MTVHLRPLTWSLVALFAVIPFQNCSQKMSAAKSTSLSSAQCRAQIKAEGLQDLSAFNVALDCGDFNAYQCERRVFAPDVESMSHSLKECLGSGSNCVDVDVMQFSTADALSRGEDPALFQPGEAYNREDVRCFHRYSYQGIPVFEGEASSLDQALAGAMAACEAGGKSP